MIIVLTTYPDMEKAEIAAEQLVNKELAACASIVKIERSIYRWKGKTEKHGEYLLMIKTKKQAYNQIERFIKENHPYEVPEIVYFEIDGGNNDYLSWVDGTTLSKLLTVPLDLRLSKRASAPSNEQTKARKPSTLSR